MNKVSDAIRIDDADSSGFYDTQISNAADLN